MNLEDQKDHKNLPSYLTMEILEIFRVTIGNEVLHIYLEWISETFKSKSFPNHNLDSSVGILNISS